MNAGEKLDGITVIDFSRVLAGPVRHPMMLHDFGADVIKD